MDSGAGGQRPNVSESGVLSIRLSVNDTESMTWTIVGTVLGG
jgi:hypothetical protein